MKECFDLQELILDSLQFDRLGATFFLLNGYQLKGRLLRYDDQVFLIESGGRQLMVYKKAVSTIQPNREIDFPAEY